jgi:NhaP-type Na+/H+ or K+/H+ antiporter
VGDLSVETVAVALFLLLAVVVSGAFGRMSPVPLPLPLVQIALGSIIASVANLGVASRFVATLFGSENRS